MTAARNRLYETVFILRPDLESGQVDSLKEDISHLLSSHNAPQVRWESWGRRKLAFPIQKANKGTYFYVLYLGVPDAASEVERVLKLNENVLRSLTVRVLENVDQSTFDFQEWSAKITPLADHGDGDDSDDSGRRREAARSSEDEGSGKTENDEQIVAKPVEAAVAEPVEEAAEEAAEEVAEEAAEEVAEEAAEEAAEEVAEEAAEEVADDEAADEVDDSGDDQTEDADDESGEEEQK